MKSHVEVILKGHSLQHNEDFSLDIEERNPIFNNNEMFSLPVQFPLDGNREVVKNIDSVQSDMRPVQLEHEPVQIKVDGMPFKTGVAVVREEEEISDTISMNVDSSTQSFDDLIGDLECREVPLKDKIQLGEKIGRVRIKAKFRYDVKLSYIGKKEDDHIVYYDENESIQGKFEPQALGFSYPGICEVTGQYQKAVPDSANPTKTYKGGKVINVPATVEKFINVSDPYPVKPYCNARVAYTHYGIDDSGKTTSSIMPIGESTGTNEDHWPFWCLDADRPQSGVCFYVMYFLECLFTHLGVSYDLSALTNIADFNRLVFFTTHHKYTTTIAHTGTEPDRYEPDDDIPAGAKAGDIIYDGVYTEDDIIPPGAHIGDPKPVMKGFFRAESSAGKMTSWKFSGMTAQKWTALSNDDFNKNLFKDSGINDWLDSRGCGGHALINYPDPKIVQDFDYTENGVTKKIEVGKNDVASISIESTITWARVQADILSMWATSENFPDGSVKSILDALENAFGIRWTYDYERKHVTAYLFRDVFRQKDPKTGLALQPIPFLGKVTKMTKVAEKITGVQMQYSAENEKRDQKKNITNGKKDYDTDYDYIDYPANNTIIDKTYQQIVKERQIENLTCYVDQTTGNAYRFKTSKEGLDAGEYHISLFEVAQFKGVEIGDCSKQNENYVRKFVSDFQPIPFTDVNYRIGETLASSDGKISTTYKGRQVTISNFNGEYKPCLAAFMDVEMLHEFVPAYIDNAFTSPLINLYFTEKLELVESYDPSKTDDCNSPLQDYDWGMAIAVMRGGGADATIQVYDYNYDGMGNSRWRTVAGQYAMTSDTMDQLGNGYDYNGVLPGDGGGERFSLKIRAYKPFVYKVIDGRTVIKDANDPEVDSTWNIPCNADQYDEHGQLLTKVRSRGLYDTFMAEYGHFLLHRKKYKIEALPDAAELIDIPNHWFNYYVINGLVGLIDKINYRVSATGGIENVIITFYAI